ncbi:Transmembrane protein 54 [Galemys pyrenaicus]|uniref:Transmembrane protein 54 n=1 Tax=Galemys pyrenaicus TaxID=202257 RepID=A0A8J5ZUD1_GALPY|nr:Transmembrane protein 54 [Galemys pyrenaicus]
MQTSRLRARPPGGVTGREAGPAPRSPGLQAGSGRCGARGRRAGGEDGRLAPRPPAASGAPPAAETPRGSRDVSAPRWMRPTHGADKAVPTGALSVGDFRRLLMKTGLVLVVLGHVSFIAAALLHGTVLRYVAAPHDAVALQYCVVNILSVTSAIVVITSGIAAIVLSRYLPSIPLRWTAFSSSVACALLSLTCALGLLASIAVTLATQGQALLAACTFGSPGLLALAPDCPFDPTRIYSSSLCLWGISLVFCVVESVFAVRCAQAAHGLLGLRPWCGKHSHYSMQESAEPVEGHDLLSCTSSEPLTL